MRYFMKTMDATGKHVLTSEEMVDEEELNNAIINVLKAGGRAYDWITFEDLTEVKVREI